MQKNTTKLQQSHFYQLLESCKMLQNSISFDFYPQKSGKLSRIVEYCKNLCQIQEICRLITKENKNYFYKKNLIQQINNFCFLWFLTNLQFFYIFQVKTTMLKNTCVSHCASRISNFAMGNYASDSLQLSARVCQHPDKNFVSD
eukprot:TRINITY_DN334_c0_g5_i1.p5 TRINITY_DN334_c0_g5~~TRINITY_DN334_c0_g5_i1.p5  ORF type:complete len:144 (+),score=1.14 TRINITY_DN334_c0_g5_i1:147-578(+)